MRPRIEYLKCIDGFTMDVYIVPIHIQIARKLLPKNLYWISIMGANYNPLLNKGPVFRATILPIPSFLPLSIDPKMEGPYLSLEHMESCSPAYNLIIRPDAIKATYVLCENLKRKKKDDFYKYFTSDFIANLDYILEHTFIGHKINGNINGIHFQSSDVRIVKHVNSNNSSRVQNVKIQKIDPITNEVSEKKALSTFWPTNWSIERCIMECAIAWSNKIKIFDSDNYIGFASDGLKIIICFRKRKLTTIYPDQSNNEIIT